ncbi:hypothetical protein INT47_012499 [Mucor saturninus]|uniref:HTH APSES-type domain-containing protein n=1 Tax=Mucor saturninus TaxID=64648 RepID=A0A8H7QP87_9FUNG|nr:hypothetical protein INT47_012499 [Mucor saturninus]
MVDFSSVFKATYSGVPVYEMLCKGVAVMRRRSDSYLNATQILKVADFDKPQRTRILEREVQTGQHEKVQGGYGKYQGTWVPFERGKALAVMYEVDKDLAPILEFVKGDESPPLAPKHVTAASARPKKARETQTRTRKRVKHYDEDLSDLEIEPTHTTTNITNTEQEDQNHQNHHHSNHPHVGKRPTRGKREKQATKAEEPVVVEKEKEEEEDDIMSGDSIPDYEMSEKPYAQKLLQYFMSSKSGISSLLLHPPRDLDINVIIDDEGHTSLHWAAAMARIKVVKLMIDNGADMYRVNYKGQTALMRSVLFTNNFESKTFDALLTLLRTTVFNIDKKDQTVFHHIATTSAWRGKIHASRYYMECLIAKLITNRSELISILNVQDAYGDTALTIAARSGNKRLVKMLIDAGASTEISNEEGMTSRDYFHEIEKNTSSSLEAHGSPPITNVSSPSSENSESIMTEMDTREILRNKIEAMFQVVTSNTGTVPPISEVFDNFAKSYDKDLNTREMVLQKKKIELDLYTKRLEETRRVQESIQLSTDNEQVEGVIRRAEEEGTEMERRLKKWLQFSQKKTLQALEEYYHKENGEKPPSPPHQYSLADLRQTESQLRKELHDLQKARKEHVDHIVQLHARIPPKKYQDYKRLISTCCNVAYENVDLMLSPLLDSFNEATEEQREEMMAAN